MGMVPTSRRKSLPFLMYCKFSVCFFCCVCVCVCNCMCICVCVEMFWFGGLFGLGVVGVVHTHIHTHVLFLPKSSVPFYCFCFDGVFIFTDLTLFQTSLVSREKVRVFVKFCFIVIIIAVRNDLRLVN